jgi:hypothetical protein
MPKLKVLTLSASMKLHVERRERGLKQVPYDFPLIGRDGYYRRGDAAWFECQGNGYQDNKLDFEHRMKTTDEALLMTTEVDAMQTIIKTSRDVNICKALRERLFLHYDAYSRKKADREGRKFRIDFRHLWNDLLKEPNPKKEIDNAS